MARVAATEPNFPTLLDHGHILISARLICWWRSMSLDQLCHPLHPSQHYPSQTTMAGSSSTRAIPGTKHKVIGLVSGGKDSCFNLMHTVANGHEIVALATLTPPTGTGALFSTDKLTLLRRARFAHVPVGRNDSSAVDRQGYGSTPLLASHYWRSSRAGGRVRISRARWRRVWEGR